MDDDSHSGLRCVRIRIRLRLRAAGAVSRSWTTTLRGGFGVALREMSCSLRRDNCNGCLLSRVCAYGYLFETPVIESDRIMRKYTQAPHPFIFESEGRLVSQVTENERAELAMVLVGGSNVYLPHVFLALQELGKKGLGRDRVPYEIESLVTENGHAVYEASRGTVLDRPTPKTLCLEPGPSRRGRFSLVFETALRLQHEGELCRKPGLAAIVAALRRRLFLLRYFHGDGCAEQLAASFLDAAQDAAELENTFDWTDAKRTSTRQGRDIPIGGVTGRITCEGDVGALEPLLRAGEYVHVGKNATFGLGKYRLLMGDQS